jgi:hypothetical protein
MGVTQIFAEGWTKKKKRYRLGKKGEKQCQTYPKNKLNGIK